MGKNGRLAVPTDKAHVVNQCRDIANYGYRVAKSQTIACNKQRTVNFYALFLTQTVNSTSSAKAHNRTQIYYKGGITMKTTTINSITYTIVNPTTKKAHSIIQSMKWAKQWWDVYDRPSQTKQDIKQYWDRELTSIDCHIHGYTGNTSNFSIYAESDTAYYYITKSHNYVIFK